METQLQITDQLPAIRGNPRFLSDQLSDFRTMIENGDEIFVPHTTGHGKTTSAIKDLPTLIEEATDRPIARKAFITTRIAQSENILNSDAYKDLVRQYDGNRIMEWEGVGMSPEDNYIYAYDGWEILTYQKLYHAIQSGDISGDTFDLIVIDEAHSLIADATFIGLACYAVIEWLKTCRSRRIWLSATPYLWERCEGLGYSEFGFSYLPFTGERKYHARQALFYMSGREIFIDSTVKRNLEDSEKKCFIVLSSAGRAFRMMERLRDAGFRVAFVCSDYNSSEMKFKRERITDEVYNLIEKERPDLAKELNEYECAIIPLLYLANNEVRTHLLKNERFPDDIDVIISTSILREGINIKDERVSLVITDFIDRTGVEQIHGRIRGDYDTFLVFNLRQREREQRESIALYERLIGVSQLELAKQYGKQESRKNSVKLILETKAEDGEPLYILNQYAYIALLENASCYTLTDMNSRLATYDKTSYITGVLSLIAGEDNVRLYTSDELLFEMNKDALKELAKRYVGIPLVEGSIASITLIEKIKELGFANAEGTEFGNRFVFALLRKIEGIEIKGKNINKSEAEKYCLPYQSKAPVTIY